MKKTEILSFLAAQKQSFRSKFGVVKLGLFGSIARGSDQPNDIDLILEFEPGTTQLFEKKLEIKKQLESEFNLPVDILRESFIKPYARKIILRDAVFI